MFWGVVSSSAVGGTSPAHSLCPGRAVWDVLPAPGSQGAADPSCMEGGLKVVPFPRREGILHTGGKCLLPGRDPDRAVPSPLGIHTWASIRMFAGSLFFHPFPLWLSHEGVVINEADFRAWGVRLASNPQPNPFLQRGRNSSTIPQNFSRARGSCVSILLPQAFGYPSFRWIYSPGLPVAPGSLHPGFSQFVLNLALTAEQSLTPRETLPCGKQAFPSSRPRDAEEWTPGDGRGVTGRAETQCWLGWSLLHHVLLCFPSGFPPPSLPGCFPCTEAVSTFPTTRTRGDHTNQRAGSGSSSECTRQI